MAEDKITLAIFDFDGTLTTGHMWLGIARHHRENRVRRLALYYYLLSHLPLWWATKLKMYSEEKNRIKWGEDLPSLFKGSTVEYVRKVFEWIADKYFMPLLRKDVIQRMEEHREKGHKILILSGMFTSFLEVMRQRIGADYVVGTKLEIIDNVYSGRIIKPLCFGENKAKLLLDFIGEKQLRVDLRASAAYADSVYDAPVLLLVGNPVATYPEKRLYQLALNQRWQIMGNNFVR